MERRISDHCCPTGSTDGGPDLSLPLWKKMKKRQINGESADAGIDKGQPPRHYTLPQLVRLRGVKEVLICFFCYCALESTAGMWAASYCTLYHGISPERAARWASLFYMGITAGRFVCGFITMKVNDRNMIRLGQAVAALGILCVLLPLEGNGPLCGADSDRVRMCAYLSVRYT